MRMSGLAIVAIAGAVLCGCEQAAVPVPTNLAAYDANVRQNRLPYPASTVCMHNLQRAMDAQLPLDQRKASLDLVIKLGGDDPDVRTQLAALLATDPPPVLRDAILQFLLQHDYPDLAAAIIGALPSLHSQSALRDAVLDWLAKHPTPVVLAEVVKMWAAEPVAGPNEPQFRAIVEQNTGAKWDQALLESLNRQNFFAGGSALEVLSHRIEPAQLRRRLLGVAPQTDPMRTLRTFIVDFDYLPTTAEELRGGARVLALNRGTVPAAARLAAQWRRDSGYQFNVRDLHLLAGLAGDPLRQTDLSRAQLIDELHRSLDARPHVPRKATPLQRDDTLDAQQPYLNVADLWRLKLLDEMLSRDHVQMAIRVMAERDRADRRHAWGGLVFYENGRANAKLYESAPGEENDLAYAASEQLQNDGRNALCRFAGHFEKADNMARLGPDAQELHDAAAGNYCGLTLASLSADTFGAHYYNPQGCVVSLGVLPLRK